MLLAEDSFGVSADVFAWGLPSILAALRPIGEPFADDVPFIDDEDEEYPNDCEGRRSVLLLLLEELASMHWRKK